MDLKPIETRYKGYRFRSRLEARYAVFFDTIGLEWQYEPEGFDLGEAGLYLPDFYFPKLNIWIEIKGEFSESGEAKAQALADATGKQVYIAAGAVGVASWFKYEPREAPKDIGLWLCSGDKDLYADAIDAARGARWEPGEKPQTKKAKKTKRSTERKPGPVIPEPDGWVKVNTNIGDPVFDAFNSTLSEPLDPPKPAALPPVPPSKSLPFFVPPATFAPPKSDYRGQVTVTLRGGDNKARDARRLKRIHGTLLSYPGNDVFVIISFEDGRRFRMDFPGETTGICQELLLKLYELAGESNVSLEPVQIGGD